MDDGLLGDLGGKDRFPGRLSAKMKGCQVESRGLTAANQQCEDMPAYIRATEVGSHGNTAYQLAYECDKADMTVDNDK